MSLELESNNHQNNLRAENEGAAYEFEGFRLDPRHLMLCRGTEEVSLTPKQAETLLALVEKHGEILSKEALMTRLWGETAVEESNLIQNIYVLRKALGETADGKPMIETLRRRGYRFTADVNRPGKNTELTGAAGIQSGLNLRPYNHKPFVAAAGILFLLGLAITAAYFLTRPQPSAAGERKQFAVLPLTPIDPGNRSNLFEIGVADALINRLNSIQNFVSRPLNATRKYEGLDQDPIAAGREQRVDHVLASNYQFADGKFRITIQLINVASGQIDESYKVETAAGDVFAIQDAVATEIGNKLIARFGASNGPAYKRGTTNEEAYRHYVQGMFLYDQRNGLKAIESLDRAVTIDPNYARAWAGLALAYRGPTPLPDGSNWREHHERSMYAINRALVLDADLADAHSALCWIRISDDFDFDGAERACRHALDLDPNSPIAFQTYAIFLNGQGRHDEAIAAVKTAIDLEPSSFFSQRLYANTLYLARRYDEARAQYQRVWELNPNQRHTYEWMIRTLEASGKYNEAFEWFLRSLAVEKAGNDVVERYTNIFKEAGWPGVLREREQSDKEGLNVFRLAGINAQLGNKDRAFELLNQAYEQRFVNFAIVRVDPQFDPVRDDPRYSELLRRMGSE